MPGRLISLWTDFNDLVDNEFPIEITESEIMERSRIGWARWTNRRTQTHEELLRPNFQAVGRSNFAEAEDQRPL